MRVPLQLLDVKHLKRFYIFLYFNLDFHGIFDIIELFREGNTRDAEGHRTNKPERKNRMRKVTLSAIHSILSNIDFENKTEIMDELSKELNKGAEARNAKAALYDEAFKAVKAVMGQTSAPLTVAEIFDTCEGLPQGFTKNQISYGLTHDWADRVVKIEGKVNTYRLPL